MGGRDVGGSRNTYDTRVRNGCAGSADSRVAADGKNDNHRAHVTAGSGRAGGTSPRGGAANGQAGQVAAIL